MTQSNRTLHYAFLTTEFPTTTYGAGGLSTYTRRMAMLLSQAGHSVEVFVLDPSRNDRLEMDGYTVHHVRNSQPRFLNLAFRVLGRLGFAALTTKQSMRASSRQLCKAVETRHAEKPFDVVQSADYLAPGIALKKKLGRVHLVRCSSAMDLYMAADGRTDSAAKAQIKLEQEAVRKADIVIAPSELVANHYSKILRRTVHVVRPPAYLEDAPAKPPYWLPRKFLVHYAGWMGARKGTELIAKALPIALAEEPDLVMLWLGRAADFTKFRVPTRNVLIANPLTKPELYAVIKEASAAVLPSQVDNIPNTLIEALLLGTPVIVSNGASQDELVSPGPGARLVPLCDYNALAKAMVEAWRGGIGRSTVPWLLEKKGISYRPDNALTAHLGNIVNILNMQSMKPLLVWKKSSDDLRIR